MTKLYLVNNELPLKGKVTSLDGRWITFYCKSNKRTLSIPHTSIQQIEWEIGETPWE